MKHMKRAVVAVFCLVMALVLLPAVFPRKAQADDGNLEINEANFPDENFRTFLINILFSWLEGDGENGYYLPAKEIETVTELNCGYLDISSLKGIELFFALETLNCDGNQLTSLDVSRNTALKSLSCSENPLGTLDVSKNTALEELHCGEDELAALDLSNNTALTSLYCAYNEIPYLELGNHTALSYVNIGSQVVRNLQCKENDDVYTLDLSAAVPKELLSNVTVTSEDCELDRSTGVVTLPSFMNFEYTYDTGMGSMDVTVIPQVEMYLVIDEKHFPDSSFRNYVRWNLPCTSVSYNLAFMTKEQVESVTDIDCAYEDIKSLAGIEYFPMLTTLNCSDNQLTSLELGGNPALLHLECASNQLTALNVSNNPSLEYLDCESNEIASLDLQNNTALQSITCDENQLTALDVTNLPDLDWLSCEENQILSLDVSNNTALESLSCDHNQMTELVLGKNAALHMLSCGYNQLKTLDLSGCVALENLYCYENQLTALDVSKCPEIWQIYCSNNNLKTLTLGKAYALQYLECENNQLTKLDVSYCPVLEMLFCANNELTELDVSKNPELWSLWCSENHLGTLNLDTMRDVEDDEEEYDSVTVIATRSEDIIGALAEGQTISDEIGVVTAGKYTYDLSKIVPKSMFARVSFEDGTVTFDSKTGKVTFPKAVESFTYLYDTDLTVWGDPVLMDVTVYLTFEEGKPAIEWNEADVQYVKDSETPYVIANGTAQTPRFVVKDKDGNTVDAKNYTYEYKENVNPGTGYVIVTVKGEAEPLRGWFKIYLPATENTYVENREDGIYLKWDPVPGAAGYVIYRRAWSSKTNGWTSFERWNNTTGTSYLDGADANHKVYAGTRYQYGVKAYFAKRTDPVSGATIGGNVGDNYNLGVVGPLKTTVRITTRELVQVRSDRAGQLTVKWKPSKNFTGYQVQISADKNFKENVVTKKIADPSAYWASFDGLASGTVYYARVRSYHEFEGMTYFGGWSEQLSQSAK